MIYKLIISWFVSMMDVSLTWRLPRHKIIKVNIEDPVEALICVKGVPVCYVHIDGTITYPLSNNKYF